MSVIIGGYQYKHLISRFSAINDIVKSVVTWIYILNLGK